jgi:hypothetical protein
MPLLGTRLNAMISSLIKHVDIFKDVIDLIDEDSAAHGNWILTISQSHDPIEILKVYLTTILAIKTNLTAKGPPLSELPAEQWHTFFNHIMHNRTTGVEQVDISGMWAEWHAQYPDFWTT